MAPHESTLDGPLDLRLLGGFRVERNGATLAAPATRKALVLMAYLAMQGGRAASRETLCGLFWSTRSEVQARGSLRQALASLKRLYGDAIVVDNSGVALAADRVTVDATRLLAAVRRGDAEEQARAAELYGGPLLAGHDAPDEGAEDWLRAEREQTRRAALLLVERLADASRADPSVREAASGLAERILAFDPAAEEAHRALIGLALAAGRTNAALRQYDACREALRRTLGAAPEARTRALIERARKGADETLAPTPLEPIVESSGAPRAGPSLVVLPFQNLGGAEAAFVDGIVEEITGALARMRDFFVIARQSAYAFKDQALDVREIGRNLGVRYALEGSVRRAGERVRIAAQLIDAETGGHLWAERFDGEIGDAFDFQDEIAARVAGALHPSLRAAEIERARKKRPDVLEAYDLVMRAYPYFWAHTQEHNGRAVALLESALHANPNYGLATALLAWCRAQEAAYLWTRDSAASQAAGLRLARRAALQVDDDATALAAIAAAETMCSGDLELAGSFVERALRIDPNHAWGWLRSGWLHHYAERFDDALDHFERALALSPLDPFAFNIHIGMGACHAEKGNLEVGMRLIETGIRARPGMMWAYRTLASAAALAGDMAKARAALATFLAAYPGMTIARMRAGMPKPMMVGHDRYWEGLRRAGMPEA